MADRQGHQVVDTLGREGGEPPGQGGAPVVAHHVSPVDVQVRQDGQDVAGQERERVRLDRLRLARTPVAAQVGHHDLESSLGQGRDLVTPQPPGIAERWLSEDNWTNFRNWAGHPDTDQVIADLEANGSLTPGLNWYRANVPPQSWVDPPLVLPPVQAPAMGVWSTGDMALTETQMTDSAENVAGPWRYERLDGPGHWMQLEVPERLNALLLDFLPR